MRGEEKMRTRQVTLPIEAIIDLLKSLDAQTREEIFEEVFIECDTSAISIEEADALKTAMNEYELGETISWKSSL